MGIVAIYDCTKIEEMFNPEGAIRGYRAHKDGQTLEVAINKLNSVNGALDRMTIAEVEKEGDKIIHIIEEHYFNGKEREFFMLTTESEEKVLERA